MIPPVLLPTFLEQALCPVCDERMLPAQVLPGARCRAGPRSRAVPAAFPSDSLDQRSGLAAEFSPCCWDHLPALFLSGLWCLSHCNSFMKSKVLPHVLNWCSFFYPFFEKEFMAPPSALGLYLVLGSSNQKIINLYKIIQYIGS